MSETERFPPVGTTTFHARRKPLQYAFNGAGPIPASVRLTGHLKVGFALA
jgi:hypothetical protein